MKQIWRIFLILVMSMGLVACQLDVPETKDNANAQDNKTEVEGKKDNKEQEKKGKDEEENQAASASKSKDTKKKGDGKIDSGKGGFLWRVQNGDTTVYLQGTIHLGVEDFYPLNDAIEDAYESADVVVPEVDITEVDLFSSIGSTLIHGVYIDGTTIEDHISKDLYKKLEETFDKQGLPIDIVKFFKPWLLTTTVNQLAAMELGYDSGVDPYFLERAKEDGKEILELESVSEQYGVLSGQSPEFQERQLEETLDSVNEFENVMQQMFSLYLDGDEEAMLDYLFPSDVEQDKEYEEYMKALNDDRNKNMAEKIAGYLEEGADKTYFVIVGTLHLIKEPHIRSLLEEKGYEVERVY
ncbi:MAG TPA: TraB/GumN family protein [Cerasibacillus sp.]|uniref:TraB/GumN family protein n=1 Tax=Cerasibacillus sp. TaxID=2498711 RepID=UPI002F40A0B1